MIVARVRDGRSRVAYARMPRRERASRPRKLFSARRTVLCAENAPVLCYAQPREARRRDDHCARATPSIGVRPDGTSLHRTRARRAENAMTTAQNVASTITSTWSRQGTGVESACACECKRLATQVSRAQAQACAHDRANDRHDRAVRFVVAFVLSRMFHPLCLVRQALRETWDKNLHAPSMEDLDNRVRRDRAANLKAYRGRARRAKATRMRVTDRAGLRVAFRAVARKSVWHELAGE